MIPTIFTIYIASVSVALAQSPSNQDKRKSLSNSRDSLGHISSLKPVKPFDGNHVLLSTFEKKSNRFSKTPTPSLLGIAKLPEPLSDPGVRRTNIRNVFKKPKNPHKLFKSSRLDTLLPPGLDFLSPIQTPKPVKQSQLSNKGGFLIEPQAQKVKHLKNWKSMVKTNQRQVGDPVAIVLEKGNAALKRDSKDKNGNVHSQVVSNSQPSFTNVDSVHGQLRNGDSIVASNNNVGNKIISFDQNVQGAQVANGISNSENLPSKEANLDLPWVQQDPWDLTFLTKQADSGFSLPWLDPTTNKGAGHNGNFQNSISNTDVDFLKSVDTKMAKTLKQSQHSGVNMTQNNKAWTSWVEPSSMNDLQHNTRSSWTSTPLQNDASNQTKGQSESSKTSESPSPIEVITTVTVSPGSDMQSPNNFFATWDPWKSDTVSRDITQSQSERINSEDPIILQRTKGFVDEPPGRENMQTEIPLPPTVVNSHLGKKIAQGKGIVDNQLINDNVVPQASSSLSSNAGENIHTIVGVARDFMDKQLTDKNSLASSSSLSINNKHTTRQNALLKNNVSAINIPSGAINLSPLIDNVGSEIQHANKLKGRLDSNQSDKPSVLLLNNNSLKQNGEMINKPLVDGNIFLATVEKNVRPITGLTGNFDKPVGNNPIAKITFTTDINTEEKPLQQNKDLTESLSKNKQIIASAPLIADFNVNDRTGVTNDKPLRDINPVTSTSTKSLSKINMDVANSIAKTESMGDPVPTPLLDNLNLVDQTTKFIDKPLIDTGPVNIIEQNFVDLKTQGKLSEVPLPGNLPIETAHLPDAPFQSDKIMPIANVPLRDHKNTLLKQQINKPIKIKPDESTHSKSLTMQRNEEVQNFQSSNFNENKNIQEVSALGKSLSTSSKTASELGAIKPIELDKKLFNVKQNANLDSSQKNEQLKQGIFTNTGTNNIDLSKTIQKLKSLANSTGGMGTSSTSGNNRKQSVVVVVKKEKKSNSDSKNNTDDTNPGHLTTHNSIFFDPKTNQEIDPFREVTREVLENAKNAWTNALATVGSSHLRVGSIPTKTTPFAVSSNSHRRSTNSRQSVNTPVQSNGQNLNFNSGDISFLDPITEGEVLRLNLPNTSRQRIRRQRPQQHQHPDPNVAAAPDNVFIGPFIVGPVDHPTGDIEFSGTLLVPAHSNAGTSVFIPNSIQSIHSQAHRPLIPRPFTRQNNDNERPQQSPVPNTSAVERLSALARLTMLTRANNAHISNLQSASLRRQGNPLVSRLGSANTLNTPRNEISQLREVVSRIVNSNSNTQSRSHFPPSLSTSGLNSNHNRHPLQMSSTQGHSRFQHINNRVSNRESPFISRNPALNQPINSLLQNQPTRQSVQSNNLIRLITERLRALSRGSEGQRNRLFGGQSQAFDIRTLLRNTSVSSADSDVRSLRNIVPVRTPLTVSPRLETRQISSIMTNPTSRIAMPTMSAQQRIIVNPSGPIWNFNTHARAIPNLPGLSQRSDFVQTQHTPWLNNRIVQINQPPVIL